MDTRGQLPPQLRDGEQLLWQGVPDPRVRFTRTDGVLLYLAVVYPVGLAVWWYFAARRGDPFLYVGGVLLAAQWFYFPGSRITYRRSIRRSGAYAVTTTRALILLPKRQREKALPDQPVKILRRDSQHVSVSIGAAGGWRYPFTFEDVADAEALLAALAQAGVQVAS